MKSYFPRCAVLVLCGVAFLMADHAGGVGQEAVAASLSGTAFVGDTVMTSGTVVLHHLADGSQGQLDSVTISRIGTFTFPLASVPDPGRGDVYFASVRHDGVLYFGPAITTAPQLDSLYEVHAYDTLLAPAGGVAVALQARSIFFEPDPPDWRVTELFQLRNDEPRTIVSRGDGRVWSHPLPREARDVTTGEDELALDAARYEGGELVVRAALSPGERLFVVRYRVDSPALSIPNVQAVEAMDLLVREPAPPLEVEGLELLDRIELEAGSTYLRFTGVDVTVPSVTIREVRAQGRPPVEWGAVLLALLFAVAGILVLRPKTHAATTPAGPDRHALLFEVARLDEEFGTRRATPDERKAYERLRADLLRRIRAAG